MKITEALKKWLREERGLSAQSSEDEYNQAAMDALLDGSLPREKCIELTTDPVVAKGSELLSKMDAIHQRLDEMQSGTSQATKAPKMPTSMGIVPDDAGDDGGPPFDGSTKVDVKSVEKMYSTTRSERRFPQLTDKGTKHPLAGKRFGEGGTQGFRPIDEPSELDKAINGAFIKFSLTNAGRKEGLPRMLKMTDHDWALMQYALHECKWGGAIHGEGSDVPGAIGLTDRKLSDFEIKAILDDSVSGGLESAPIMFDNAIIETPLLTGELFPIVNTVNISRGRRVEGSTLGNVTAAWAGSAGAGGEGAGNLIPLVNTASFVGAFDTTIFVWHGAIELGMDFMSDSPVSFGSTLTAQFGTRLMQMLDDAIATGNGTSQPTGVLNTASLTDIGNPAGGAGAAPQIVDYITLLFAVTKPFRSGTPANRIVYSSTEETYQRARSLAVGGGDNRLQLGHDIENYAVFGHPFKINESFTSAQIVFFNAAHYRMYRRLGIGVKTTTEGRGLVRENNMLISARARYGGRLELAGYGAFSDNFQA